MRKSKTVVIDAEGRDKGKTFVLTEMAAMKAEKWAMRALLAMTRGDVEVPANMEDLGLAGLAVVGLRGLKHADFAEAEPLLDEMMTCVTVRPDPAHPEVTRPLWDADIEEIDTLVRLRQEVFELHVDFSKVVANWKQTAATDPAGSPNTETSPDL